MRNTCSTILAAMILGCINTNAEAEPGICPGMDTNSISIALNQKSLGRLGFQPEGELFENLSFYVLDYTIGAAREVELPNGNGGETITFTGHKVTTKIAAHVRSARTKLLTKIRKALPTPEKNDSNGAKGGFMRIENRTRLRYDASIWGKDYSSKVSWWKQGSSTTPVHIYVNLKPTPKWRDFAVDGSVHFGPTSASSPFSTILDVLTLPVTVITSIIGENSLGDVVNDKIAEGIDGKVASLKSLADEEVDRLFDTGSLNNLFRNQAVLLLQIYKGSLFFSNRAGFKGSNPEPIIFFPGKKLPAALDADVDLILEKTSIDSEPGSYVPTAKACQILSDLRLLNDLASTDENATNEEMTVKTGENLDLLSIRAFGSRDYAMTIGQTLGFDRYTPLREGQQFVVPSASKLYAQSKHFVE